MARALSGMRGFYRWLLMDKRIAEDPTVNVESPASWKVLPKSLSEADVREMLERTEAAARAGGCGERAAAGPCDSGAAVCGRAAGGGDLRAAGGGFAAGCAAGSRCGARAIRSGWCRWGGQGCARRWSGIWSGGGRGWCGRRAGCSGRCF